MKNKNMTKFLLLVIVLLFTLGVATATDNTSSSHDVQVFEKTTTHVDKLLTNTETNKNKTESKKEITKKTYNIQKKDSTRLYVSPDITEAKTGTYENPTTIPDAIGKISNNGNIILLPGSNGVYKPTTQIVISDSTTQSGTNKFSLSAPLNTNIKIDASQVAKLFQISTNYDITFNNISICNAINTAIDNGGNITLNGAVTYTNNIASGSGGLINSWNGDIIINGSNIFTKHSCGQSGSVINVEQGTLTINGNNTFSDNSFTRTSLTAIVGGVIRFYSKGNLIINGSNKFTNNNITTEASIDGGVIYSNGNCTITGENIFKNNTLTATGTTDGTVMVVKSSVMIRGSNRFENNIQFKKGFGISGRETHDGGAINGMSIDNFQIEGLNIFKNNTAYGSGGAIYIELNPNANTSITGNNIFENNNAVLGAAIKVNHNTVTNFKSIGTIFRNNNATDTGIVSVNSNKNGCTNYISENKFINNTCTDTILSATVNKDENSYLTITNNLFKDNIEGTETVLIQSNCQKTIKNNTYINTHISLGKINLNTTITQEEYTPKTDIPLTYTTSINYPRGYDEDTTEKLYTQIYINNENKYNITGNTFTINEDYTIENQGTLNIYVKIGSKTSNNLTIKLQKPTYENTYFISDKKGLDTNTGDIDSPLKTIQAALDKIENNETYTIYIDKGIYKGIGNTNLTVNGNYNINIIGNGINQTTIDGEANYTIRKEGTVWGSSLPWHEYINGTGNHAMTITQGNGQITLSNMTIAHMWCPGGDAINLYEHAPVDNYGNLIVDNLYFYYNNAGVGSAIRNNHDATILINNTLFEENRKSSATGNNGIFYNNGTATVLNSIFNHNLARWGSILNDHDIIVINTTFSNNIGYDGTSTYKYGPGFAYNSGGADFFTPGNFDTTNIVMNCTFINNDQCDIYGYMGPLNATNNQFLNSTGIRIVGGGSDVFIVNNTITGTQPSMLTYSMSTGVETYSISSTGNKILIENNTIEQNSGIGIQIKNGNIKNNKITIENTTSSGIFVSDSTGANITHNTLNRMMNITGNNIHIENNTIITEQDYTIAFINNPRYVTVTNNYLQAKFYVGDVAVQNPRRNVVENNTPDATKNVYVKNDVTKPATGTMNNPTTLQDAISKVKENESIILINGQYNITETILIDNTKTLPTTRNFKIIGLKNALTTDSNETILNGKQNQILKILTGYNITIENITFTQAKATNGAAIYTESNLTIHNSQLTNSTATNGAAIYAKGNINIQLNNNIFQNNNAENGGASATSNSLLLI